jgi:signal transduction histidine kinase
MSESSHGDSDSTVWAGAGGGESGPLSPSGASEGQISVLTAAEEGAAEEGAAGDSDQERFKCSKTDTGWLVTSCDVGAAEPQSLSEELERLQVLKSYHIMDHERDESVDLLTRMAALVLDTPFTFLSLVDMGRIWFRCNPDSDCEQQLTREMLSSLSRVIMKRNTVFDIPDITQDEMFQKTISAEPNSNSDASSSIPRFRYFAGAPLVSPEGYRLGAFCMLDTRPRSTTEEEKENLDDFARIMVKEMVDRRKLTTQGSPSHLVACTAHDLITPLTGIQLSLSLLQQDGDFQAKLGDKRIQYTSAAVRSSNMMLRICQSTIETLRGNRKIPSSSSDWALPRNLMHMAEASPFIDMKEFTSNLEAISNSIPKQVPLTITLHRSAPTNIVSDGLKIFRSALNLLSNACTRANTGFINMAIFDDEDGSLIFECEDTGKEVDSRDSQSLFSQDIDTSNFGLYSVAYQINWLGGKYGVRKRDTIRTRQPQALVNGESTARSGILAANANSTHDQKGHEKGAIFWFSIPIVLPQDVSELMGLAKSLSGDGTDMAGIPTFQANLPATPPASPIIEESIEASGSPTSVPEDNAKKIETTRSLNALIIEDSTTVRKILGRALSKLGYQVYEAADGMEGLRELKATMFDMVLCDFLMPVMDGLCAAVSRMGGEASNSISTKHCWDISARQPE